VAEFCAEGGCNGIAETGKFCPLHIADNYIKRKNAARPERDSWYNRAAWRGPYGVRGYKLRRNPMCERCPAVAEQVHHRDSSWKTTGNWFLFMGGVDMENLESLCAPCHSKVTFEENRNV
jgi:5-methylcytosine-specific restriction endonuclease McrA